MKNGPVIHIDPKDYDGPQRSRELEDFYLDAKDTYEQTGVVHPGLTKVKFKDDKKPEWIGEYQEVAVQRAYKDHKVVIMLEQQLAETQAELFKLESVPLKAGTDNEVSVDSGTLRHIINKVRYNAGQIKFYRWRESLLIHRITEMQNKIGQNEKLHI